MQAQAHVLRQVTGEDKVVTDMGECKQYCDMSLLALIHGLREFVTVVYGPVMSFAFPDVQIKAYGNSVLYVNLVSVVDCSMLNWVEQKELRGLASDDRLFERIAEKGWVLTDFNNNFKCRMGREDLSHVQFNPKLWNLRPLVKDSGEAMRVPLLPETYAHVKDEPQLRSFQNHLQDSENTQSHLQIMNKAKIDALIPCSVDIMDA